MNYYEDEEFDYYEDENRNFNFDFSLDEMPPISCLNGIYDPYNGFEDPNNIMSGLISTKELIDDDYDGHFMLFVEDQRNYILSRRFTHYGDNGNENDNEWVYMIGDTIFDNVYNDNIPDDVVKYYSIRADYLKEKALKEEKEIKMDKLIQRIENMEKLLTEHNID